MFVDDEPNVLDGLRRLLTHQKRIWDMTFVDSADRAYDKCLEKEFDVVVSDVKMPQKDGFGLLRDLRSNQRTKDIPFVILTGLNEKGIKKRALNMGAVDLLNKPAEVEELTARLNCSLRLKSKIDQFKSCNRILEEAVKERTLALTKSQVDIILRLGNLAEIKEKDTEGHGVKVACYSRIIAQSMGLDKVFIDRLFLSSPLHDIGKVFVSQKILFKKDILSFEEWTQLHEHCIIGEKILIKKIEGISSFYSLHGLGVHYDFDPQSNPYLEMASFIALTHHEWWNGKGYPQGLAGKEIPLESRIVALADVYDELTSNRPYRAALSDDEALFRIRKNIGTQFDPEVSTFFEISIDEIRSCKNLFREEKDVQKSG